MTVPEYGFRTRLRRMFRPCEYTCMVEDLADRTLAENERLRNALRIARDFVIAIDYESLQHFEPRRVEMVHSIDTILGEAPK